MYISYESTELDAVLEALANQKRRGIVHELSLHPSTVGQLARQFELSLPAIHKHINILETAKLIIRRKAGRTNYTALNPEAILLVQDWVNQYKTEWGNANATLDNYISSMQE